jgi:hypothetical protein
MGRICQVWSGHVPGLTQLVDPRFIASELEGRPETRQTIRRCVQGPFFTTFFDVGECTLSPSNRFLGTNPMIKES